MQNEKEFLPIEKIVKLFPNEFVLLGNPTFENIRVTGGFVLDHNKTKSDLARNAKNSVNGFTKTAVTFTGEIDHNKRYLL
ncbi:MAG: hypothetical protein ABI723_00605 [Bacteroidia bacterium]